MKKSMKHVAGKFGSLQFEFHDSDLDNKSCQNRNSLTSKIRE